MASQTMHSVLKRLALFLLIGACAPAVATDLQQVITLKPGWNAVFVEVEPNQRELDTLFAGMPVLSVWRWLPTRGDSQFIRDPAEGLENLEGWFGWFPEPRPEAFLSNLFRMDGNTAYLIRLGGTQNRQLVLTGQPRFRAPRWEPSAFTLTGLPVDPAQPPTFAEFFSASAAHQGQPVFALGADGRWQQVSSPAATTVKSGEAYWIWTQGRSRYQGRLHVVLEQGDSLEYSAALEEIRVVLRNFSGVNGSFLVERLGADPLPLLWRNEDPETGEVGWPNLQTTLMVDAPANEDVFLTLAVRRRAFTGDRMDDILSIRDEHGQRVLLYAGGNTIQPGGAAAAAADSLMAKTAGPTFAGLWVGEVRVDAVSEAQRAGTTPTPTGREFIQRFLIHVDGLGQARLLKDVIQMWEEGTMIPSSIDPSLLEVDQPGRFVLLTDKNLIGLYNGAALRGGQPVGVRFSTVAYDFADETLEMVGGFGPAEQLSTTIVVEPELPTNPFLHRYHPDHDNLDAQFLNFRLEAYQVVRNIQLSFTVEDPLGRNPPGWGDSVVGGVFSESITGLHKNTIFTSGLFRLRRVSAVPVLNQ
jgi:hypothetical protein